MKFEGILFSYETYPVERGYEALSDVRRALTELEGILKGISDIQPLLRPDGVKGLILLDLRQLIGEKSTLELNHIRKHIVDKLKELMDMGNMLNISKIRIIDKICDTNLDCIIEASKSYKDIINADWRITLRSRKLLNREEVIREVAKLINAPVNLKNPIYNLHIEVLGPTYTMIYLVIKEKENETIIRF